MQKEIISTELITQPTTLVHFHIVISKREQ